jgi:hypothetical protein
MEHTSSTRIRIGFLGVGSEQFDLLPALYHDPRAEVAWIQTAGPSETVDRLGSLLSFPVVREAPREVLTDLDILIYAAQDGAPPAGLPPDLLVLSDIELSSFRGEGGFRWERVLARARDGAGEASGGRADRAAEISSSEEPAAALPELPGAIPPWFDEMTRGKRLGEWLARRTAQLSGAGSQGVLLVVMQGDRCVAVATAAGGVVRVKRAACRIAARLGAEAVWGAEVATDQGTLGVAQLTESQTPHASAAACGLGTARLSAVRLKGERGTTLYVVTSGARGGWVGLVRQALLSEAAAVRAWMRLSVQEEEARSWRRLRRLWRSVMRNGAEPTTTEERDEERGRAEHEERDD